MAETAGPKWWSNDTVAIVTGGNRGIGLEIARQVATQGLSVVLADVVSDEELKKTAAGLEEELRSKSSSARVYYRRLDIRSDESVQQFAAWVKETFGHFSVLVNNAGIGKASKDYRYAEDTMETNFWGTNRVTKALLPLMTAPEGGRIVFISSRLGLYTRLHDGYGKKKLSDVEHLTEGDLDEVGRRYLDDTKVNRMIAEGWMKLSDFYPPTYGESKMLVSAYTVLLAKLLETEDGKEKTRTISANAVCPGPTLTSMMTDQNVKLLNELGAPIKSIPEGADTPVWLILLPQDGYPNGKFFAEREEYPYGLELPAL